MADEQQAIAPSGQETAPAPEQIETTVADEPERIPEPHEAGGDVAEQADDEEDLEWEGRKFRAPKALKEKLSRLDNMDRDYTQKSQKTADRERALEAQAAQIEERTKATDAELETRVQLRHVNSELERFKVYDWNAYQQARLVDPMAADEAWNYAQHMRGQKAELEGKLGEAQKARSQAAQRDIAKRVEDAKQFAKTNIKGWTPELDNKIGDFALKELGLPKDFLARNMGPKLYEVLHKAYIGQETLKSSAAPRPPGPAPAPLATVNGRSSPGARGNLADMDMESYVAARKKGVGGAKLR